MVVVWVDEVLQAPVAFVHYRGVTITLYLKEPDSVKMGQQLIFFTNIIHSWTLAEGIAITEVGRMEAPASSDTLRQQIAAAKQRLADQELQRQVEGVKSLLIGVIKKYNTNEGCGCYFKTPKAAQKARWQAIGPYVFHSFQDIDDLALINIDGKDIKLN